MAYAPAANLTTSPALTHFQATYYEKKGLDRLGTKFQFRSACEPDIMPLRSGKTIQFYRYSQLGANTTPASEGTIGTSLSPASATISATIVEYGDFINGSSLVLKTAIDPIKENFADLLGYRAGFSADTIVRTEFDSNLSSVQQLTLGATLTANDLRRAVSSLEGVNVLPKMANEFVGIFHPYVLYDLQSDNSAGGFIDVMKYANPDAIVSGEVGKMAGVRIVKSTNVATTGTAPAAKYYGYVVGKGAVGAIDLAGNGPSAVTDPMKQAFKINVIDGSPSIYDPMGMIGFAVSYYFAFVAKTLDSTTYRYKIILADSSII
jgi:N4-gp56 family major capsid protein